jgi:L-fucose isomerase-like protein
VLTFHPISGKWLHVQNRQFQRGMTKCQHGLISCRKGTGIVEQYAVRVRPRIGFLPLGRLNDDGLRRDYDLGRELVHGLDADVVEGPLTWTQADVLDRVAELNCADIDLLVLYVLHGMSAEQQTLAGVKANVPAILWGLPTNYSFSSCASAVGALRERGRIATVVSAPVGDSTVVPKLDFVARVAFAMEQLKRCRIGTIGGIFPNLPADQYHRDTVADRIGPQVIHLPITHVQQALSEIPELDPMISELVAKLQGRFKVRANGSLLRKAARFHLALHNLARAERLTAVGLECHTEVTPLFGINPCLGFADPERTYLPVCEGDVVHGVHMLMLNLLTGMDSYVGDTMSLHDGVLTLGHCGSGCRWTRANDAVIAELRAPGHVGVDTDMAICIPQIPPGDTTVTRLYGRALDHMHLSYGEIVGSDTSERLIVHVRLNDPDAFMDEISGNHYVLTPGDLRPQLQLLCKWLGVTVHET